MAKKMNRILEERNILAESQHGFRKKIGTRDNIFILNSLIENKLNKLTRSDVAIHLTLPYTSGLVQGPRFLFFDSPLILDPEKNIFVIIGPFYSIFHFSCFLV